MRTLLTFGRYLAARYGGPVRKIPLSVPGFTCPNIDGYLGRGGCSYCENESFSPNLKSRSRQSLSFDSSNPFLDPQLQALRTQYRSNAKWYRAHYGVNRFIAYFQSFSNTYAPLDTLKALYSEALNQPGCVGLSIGTRADCLREETIDFLSQLAQKHDVWVEIGVQSVHNETLEATNRMERFEAIAATIEQLSKRGIKVCAHLIFGLPDESDEQMLKSVDTVCALPIDSIKIHPLYVVENTALAAEYRMGSFKPIEEGRYIRLVLQALERIPPAVSLQRITAGVDDDSLIAPQWCRDKNRLMGTIRRTLLEGGLRY
jgi:radical SAM protein (TIGR01212 family)